MSANTCRKLKLNKDLRLLAMFSQAVGRKPYRPFGGEALIKLKTMKVLVQYVCEVCGEKFANQSSAEECESQSTLNKKLFPIGLLSVLHHGDEYIGAFAVARINESNNKHLASFSHWACRDRRGDNLGSETCGSGSVFNTERALEHFTYWSPQNYLHRPEFKRLVKWLRDENISPCYYNTKGDLIHI